MVVFVEEAIMDDPLLTKNPAFTPHLKDKLMTFTEGKDDLTDKIDFIGKSPSIENFSETSSARMR